MPVSFEMLFYGTWMTTSTWENEPKLKETMVNNFQMGYHWAIERVYTWGHWVNETICQNCMALSQIFSWCHQVWLLTPLIFPKHVTLHWWVKKIKNKSHFQVVCKPVNFKLLLFLKFAFHNCPLAGFWIFLSFNSVTSALPAHNFTVFKPTIHDLGKSS